MEQPTTIGGRYILHQKLGEGGMGAIYRASDRLTGENCALKRVAVPAKQLQFASRASLGKSDNYYLALAREFKTLASLRHPHIISVLDYGFDEQRQPYLTMELLENASNLIEAGRGQPHSKQVVLLVQILHALTYLHRRGIIHRDLKPDNVLVVEDQVKVLDFGLALAREHLAETGNEVVGTLAYMAPEVFDGEPASEAADLYAVGVMAYELFAGRHPFNTTSLITLIHDIHMTTPDVISLGLGDELANILNKLLAKNPTARYRRAHELINLYAQAIHQPTLVIETPIIRESFLQAAGFVGRETELGQLVNALKAALRREGSAWLVGGESGVGKSRLLDELRAQALIEGMLVVRGQAVSAGGTAYQVWHEVFHRFCLIGDLTDSEVGVLKVLAPDISRLLGRDVPDAPQLPPQMAYQRLLKVMVEVMERQTQPLVIILEDIQWASDESLALVAGFAQNIANISLLLIANYRDDEHPHLPGKLPAMRLLKLTRLAMDDIASLSESMLGAAGRQPEVVKLLHQETEGNPFFIVEVVRALAEEAGRLDQVAAMNLPSTIFAGGMQTVIQRRLQRAPVEAHSLLQMAAVAGRQIDINLLQHIDPATSIEEWLNDCAEAAVLEVQEGYWRFAHDKLREGLLLNLPVHKQKMIHHQVAEAIEGVYTANLSPFYPRLAYHWRQVIQDDPSNPLLVSKAIDYLQKSGEQAVQNYATLEAINFFKEATVLLKTLPDTPERNRQELRLQLTLGAQLAITRGYAAPEVEATFARARALSQQMERTPQLFPVLFGLWRFYLTSAKHHSGRDLAEQCLSLAQQLQDRALLIQAHHAFAFSLYCLGELVLARQHLEQSLNLYQPEQHHSLAFIYGTDPGVHSLSLLSWPLWLLGYPDQALAKINQAFTLAQELSHPMSQAVSLGYASCLHQFRQEWQAAQEQAETTIDLCMKHGIMLYLGVGKIIQGWALTGAGLSEAATRQIRQGVEAFQATGAGILRPYFLGLLAEAHWKAGQIEAGLERITEALTAVEANDEHISEAELYRLKGELLLKEEGARQEGGLSPEACFLKAIEVAHRQEAKLWELRATVSLSRLWQKQGKTEEARQMLAQIYNWFTEGFDTPDLKEAKALLEALS